MKKLAFLLCLMPSLAGASGIFNPGSGGSAASGGASSLQVTQSGVEITSPTASINFRSGDFKVRSIGTTSYVLLDPGATNYIQNTLTPSAATQKFSVATGTFTTKAVTPNITFSATSNLLTHQDGTQLLSLPDVNSMYWGYNTNLINTGGVFNLAVGPTAMPYPGSGNFNTAVGPYAMSGNVITTAENNNAIGYASCGALRAGFYNNCMGGSSGNLLRDGNYNTYVGTYAGRDNVDKNGNTRIGFESGKSNNAGEFETTVGYQAGQGTTTVENVDVSGTGNSYIGKQTGQGVPSATVVNNSFALGIGALVMGSGEGSLGGRLGSGTETNVYMTSMTVESTYAKVNGKNICLADGTNCPVAAASEFKVSLTTGTIGFVDISTQTDLAVAGSATLSNDTVVVGPISLSTGVMSSLDLGSAFASGTLAAGRMPALTGDVTSGVGTVATTLATTIANAHTFSGAITLATVVGNAVTISSNVITPGATIYQNGVIGLNPNTFSASLPLQTDAAQKMVSLAIDLGTSQAGGTLAAGRMPALLGDTTSSAGSLTTVLNTTVANNHNFTGQLILGGNGNNVQISSNSVLVGATFYQNGSVAMDGPVVMGTLGRAVTISSNTVLPGATFYQSGLVLMTGPVKLGTTAGNSVTISSNAVLGGCTFYQNGVIGTNLTVSLPVKTDASGSLTAAAVNLSGTEATGTMAAARMPALTGDVTTSAGAVATTMATTIANSHTFSGVVTFSNSANAVTLSAGQLRLFSRTNVQIGAITPGAVGEMLFCSDCTAIQICVSSGTAVGAFASPVAKTTACK